MNLTRDTAAKIMGWRAIHGILGHLSGQPAEGTGKEEERAAVPNFAEEIEPAWRVVEEMHRSGYGFQLTWETSVKEIRVEFSRPGDGDTAQAQGDVAPEVICRAALGTRLARGSA